VAIDDYWITLGEPRSRCFIEVSEPKADGTGDTKLGVLLRGKDVHDGHARLGEGDHPFSVDDRRHLADGCLPQAAPKQNEHAVTRPKQPRRVTAVA